MSIADEIQKLAALRDSGAISEAEFESAKARVLAHDTASVPPGMDSSPPPAAAPMPPPVGVSPLRRSVSDRWLGGVCGGLAEYIGIESWVVRLFFVLTLWFFASGLFAYLVLWIFIPEKGRS